MNGSRKIVVAMSGGVDSSVAAGLLVEQGHAVVGITIKTHNYEDVGGNLSADRSCCSLEGINDARAVAARFGFPHYVLDFSEVFAAEVITDFVSAYLAGQTPNPCVLCNRRIKWEELIRKAGALGADMIATGHYAAVRYDQASGRHILSRGADRGKDQSYALWGLTQESLQKTLFPLGGMTKAEVRSHAERMGLSVAGKGESFEICFIPDDNYERFLKERVKGLADRVAGGEIVRDGRVVGRHRGYPFYTIGQRKGLSLALGEPVYVTAIDPGVNRVEVGTEPALYRRGLVARAVNMVKYSDCDTPRRVHVAVRYKDEGAPATARTLPDGRLRVDFDSPRRAITPGQSAVLYEDDDVVGGGIIDASLNGDARLAENQTKES